MSLENEIKKLREALEANTKALTDQNISKLDTPFTSDKQPEDILIEKKETFEAVATETIEKGQAIEIITNPECTETKKAFKEVKLVKNPKPLIGGSDVEENFITTQEVKDLAKEKMSQGIDRSVIKKEIEKLVPGGSISDLNQEQLVILKDKINKLK